MSTEPQQQQLSPCDLVMKGGSTSGIVYPPVIAELSQKYRFMNIGGTSAGAIAAAVTASAEYGRQCGHIHDFSLLNQLSDDLSQSGRLLELFRSTAPAHMRPVLDTLLPLVSNVQSDDANAEGDQSAPALAGAALTVADHLAPELLDLLKAQFGLRMQLATQQLSNSSQISKVRRDIARVRTLIREKAVQQ